MKLSQSFGYRPKMVKRELIPMSTLRNLTTAFQTSYRDRKRI